MRYSELQKQQIKQQYDRIKRDVKLAKIRSDGIQNVIVDKQIEEALIDKRNSQDIQNDIFARQALLNDYSNELIKNGDAYSFQRMIVDEGLDEFFLNNFPKIKSESKNFRTTSPRLMFELVQRLFNKAENELEMLNINNTKNIRYNDIKGLLENFKNSLEIMAINSTNAPQQQYYTDAFLKMDALIQGMEFIGNKIQYLEEVFKTAYPDIQNAINTIGVSMPTIPTTPNQPIPPLNPTQQQLLAQINPQVLQQAVNNQTQTKGKSLPPSILNSLPKDITEYNDKDFQALKDAVNNDDIDIKEYGEFLSDLTGIKFKQFKSKGRMYEIFEQNKDSVINSKNTRKNENRKAKEQQDRNQRADQERILKANKRKLEADKKNLEGPLRSLLGDRNKLMDELREREEIINMIPRANQFMTDIANFIKTYIFIDKPPGVMKSELQEKLKEFKSDAQFGYLLRDIRGNASGGNIYQELRDMADFYLDAQTLVNIEAEANNIATDIQQLDGRIQQIQYEIQQIQDEINDTIQELKNLT